MKMPEDQIHFIHALEHLEVARRELWEATKNWDSPAYVEDTIEPIDSTIKRVASMIR
jgi:hypothetical protein